MDFNRQLFSPSDDLLVAFSGGVDSLACLHYLLTIHETSKIFAFHLNHSIRKEADSDEQFCKNFCLSNNISFFSKKIDVKKVSIKQKKSLEETGRDIRYKELINLAKKIHKEMSLKKIPKIITAHHLDDQVETILMKFFQGTSGLRIGINEKIIIRKVEIVRPLLAENKTGIIEYCKNNNLLHVEDVSNNENHFLRNKIRNTIIPIIKESINPNITETLKKYKKLSNETSFFIDRELSKAELLIKNKNIYSLNKFLKTDTFLQKELIKKELKNKDINLSFGLIEEILQQLFSKKPNISYKISKTCSLIKEYDKFYFELNKYSQEQIIKNSFLSLGKNSFKNFSINIYQTSSYISFSSLDKICIDEEKINIDSLELRKRQKGDLFQPLGMNGHKKLKNFFIDLKIPTKERNKIKIVSDKNGIIWIIGYQLDNRVKVTSKSKKFLIFEYQLS
jgi:tRNA(Ile)-lysidine synthase